jgi:hypothetical protein
MVIQETKTHPTPEMIEEITLAGKAVRLEHKDLPIDSVKLDRKNQRVQYFLRGQNLGTMNEEEVEEALEKVLWDIPAARDLYRQVKANQGLIERIIVRADRTVIEGNCRTVVYRKLRKDFPDDPKWQQIESRILPADIEESQISVLLGNMHVAGKNEWTPYEQAAYLYHMHEELKFSLDTLADHLRLTKRSIMQKINAFRLQGEFLEKYPEPKTNIYKYSYFEEFFKKFPKKEDYEQHESEFVDLVGQDKLDKGAEVRDLPDIIQVPNAYKALKSDGYKAAMGVLSEEDPSLGSKFFSTVDKMIKAFGSVATGEDIAKLKDGDPHAVEKIKQLHVELLDFARLVDIRLK